MRLVYERQVWRDNDFKYEHVVLKYRLAYSHPHHTVGMNTTATNSACNNDKYFECELDLDLDRLLSLLTFESEGIDDSHEELPPRNITDFSNVRPALKRPIHAVISRKIFLVLSPRIGDHNPSSTRTFLYHTVIILKRYRSSLFILRVELYNFTPYCNWIPINSSRGNNLTRNLYIPITFSEVCNVSPHYHFISVPY